MIRKRIFKKYWQKMFVLKEACKIIYERFSQKRQEEMLITTRNY